MAELPTPLFEEFYRSELRAIAALATTLSGSREVGADLANEAMLRVYRDWARVSTLDRPGAWARRVAVNLAIDHQRRRTRELRALHRLEHTTPTSHTDVVLGDVASDRFWRMVRTLPENQRAAVALRYVDDMGVHDIALLLDLPEGTVKSLLYKARQTLSRLLAGEVAS